MIKKVILKLISANQGGFIVGRQIFGNVLLVQEAIHSSQKRQEPCMAIKLDLANAFDRIKHDFIYMLMRKYGFSSKFIRWIKACINAP